MNEREIQKGNIRDRLNEIVKCQSIAVDKAEQIARSLVIEPEAVNRAEERVPDCLSDHVDMIMEKAEKLEMLLDRISMTLFG